MGLWDNTAFVRASAASVADALRALFVRSGRVLGSAVPSTRRWNPMQYGCGATSARWAALIVRGPGDWCAVKTAPFQLLSEKDDDGVWRLSRLTRTLGTEAFQYNVHDGDSHTLFESAHGETRPSGFVGASGFTPNERAIDAAFEMLSLPGANQVLRASLEESPFRLQALLGFDEPLDNRLQISHLIEGQDFNGGICIFGEAAAPPRAPDLRVPARVVDGALHLQLGAGEVHLGRSFVPWDATDGAPALRTLAHWLGAEDALPDTVGYPAAPPRGVHVSTQGKWAEGASAHVFVSRDSAVPLHVDFDGEAATLREEDPFQRRALIEGLGKRWIAERRWPDAYYQRFSRVQAQASLRSPAGVPGQASVWALSRSGLFLTQVCEEGTRILRVQDPTLPPVELCRAQGDVVHMAPLPRGVIALLAPTGGAYRTGALRVATFDGHGETAVLPAEPNRTHALVVSSAGLVALHRRPPKKVPGLAARRALEAGDLARYRDLFLKAQEPGQVSVHEAATGRTLETWSSACEPLRWLPDGRLLLSRPGDPALRIWSADAGETEVRLSELRDQTPSGETLQFEKDGLGIGDTLVPFDENTMAWFARRGVRWLDDAHFVLPQPPPASEGVVDRGGHRRHLLAGGDGFSFLGVLGARGLIERGSVLWWAEPP